MNISLTPQQKDEQSEQEKALDTLLQERLAEAHAGVPGVPIEEVAKNIKQRIKKIS